MRALFAGVHRFSERPLQPVEVDLSALGPDLRKQPQQLAPLFLGDVQRLQVHLLRFVGVLRRQDGYAPDV